MKHSYIAHSVMSQTVTLFWMYAFILEELIRVSSQPYRVYVRVRPGAEDFIREMAKIYEVVIFTASLAEVKVWHNGSTPIQ